MEVIVEMIDRVLSNADNPAVAAEVSKQVHVMMSNLPLFAW
jgi:glycine hydroxymethyltransferase